MRIQIFVFLAVLALTTYFFSNAAVANDETRKPLFNAETFMLDNGMQVVVVPNHRVPVVTHMVWYYVGGADEERGQSGIAHLLEHMMFKGSPNVPTGTFSTTVKSLGGQDNVLHHWTTQLTSNLCRLNIWQQSCAWKQTACKSYSSRRACYLRAQCRHRGTQVTENNSRSFC